MGQGHDWSLGCRPLADDERRFTPGAVWSGVRQIGVHGRTVLQRDDNVYVNS